MGNKAYRKKLSSGKWVTHVSADQKPEPGEWWSWIEHYRKLSGNTNPRCSAIINQKNGAGNPIGSCDYRGKPTQGAHVLLGKNPTKKTQWIVPVCANHNDGYGVFSTGDPMKVKGVYAVRARMGLTKNQQKHGKGTPKKSKKSKTKIMKTQKFCTAVQDNGKICGNNLTSPYRVRCGKHQHHRFRN